MNIRVYTAETYLDLELNNVYNESMLTSALEECSVIALTKKDGNIFILNMQNAIALEILHTPPIKKEKSESL